jgi:serine/threonine-protein kinase
MGENLGGAIAVPPAEGSLVGRELGGQYRIRMIIAEGGMATVYRATDLRSGADVAVKVMHSRLTLDRGFALRFKREGLIARRLTHPSIVRVLDHGVDGHLYSMVMELLDGEDMFDVLVRRKRLAEAMARRIVIEICEALQEAHALGIVHRDLKPENVFLCHAGAGELRVKVLDFGVAKMLLPEERNVDDAEPVLTAMGTLLGTPEYLSPEMCRGETVGPGADIYACGVLLYALITGRPPFVTEDPIHVTLKHMEEEPLPPSWFVPGLEPALDAVVLKALAKQPEARQPSAAALAEALAALGPAPPLPADLLGGGAVPRATPEAPTLSVPTGRSVAPPAPPPPSPAPERIEVPPSLVADTVRSAAQPLPPIVWVLMAGIAVGLAFVAGVAVGRATPAPVQAPPPSHAAP